MSTTIQPLTIGKNYLVSQEDKALLPPPPRGKRMLVVNTMADVDSVVDLIRVGIQTIFTQGCVLDYTYQDTEGGIHGHIFTEVMDKSLIPIMEQKEIAAIEYVLQHKKGQVNPHDIGKSSRSAIWTNKPIS